MTLSGRVLTVACPCPGTPHTEDQVTFRAVLPYAGGIAVVQAIATVAARVADEERAATAQDLAAELFPIWIDPKRGPIEAWTFTDAAGEPLPIADGDKALPFDVKYEIADAADDLFGDEVTRPLAKMMETPSPNGQTGASTSPNRTNGRKRRSPSARSSPTTSAATEP